MKQNLESALLERCVSDDCKCLGLFNTRAPNLCLRSNCFSPSPFLSPCLLTQAVHIPGHLHSLSSLSPSPLPSCPHQQLASAKNLLTEVLKAHLNSGTQVIIYAGCEAADRHHPNLMNCLGSTKMTKWVQDG